MEKMESYRSSNGTVFKFTNTKSFSPHGEFREEIIDEVFNFAYGMSFGSEGVHRNYRSGGTHQRKNGEVFADTFQGKLAEFAIYNIFTSQGLEVSRPDTDMYNLGSWDSGDFEIGKRKLSIKSTKSYGQLLLLESKDWNEDGLYIPDIEKNGGKYDASILVRLHPFASDILKGMRSLYSSSISADELYANIIKNSFKYEIAGFVTRGDLKRAINNQLFVPRGAYLNKVGKNNKLDASNYYVQTGDMRSIKLLIEKLKEEIKTS
ncbi:hypothetical protein GLW08_12675 [Pontibacillus yanchengensis]|uniref:Uncharacterized protein n=1 Tax=Pontibacillus yanchengensis TaxID=462910 RepID=A0ACC7VHE6_9BACI|nr:hypothetical protein [Pontibacillus yanchengensis]MYL54192.1 hypothetical protein [Pontibacillus yanchengensis]